MFVEQLLKMGNCIVCDVTQSLLHGFQILQVDQARPVGVVDDSQPGNKLQVLFQRLQRTAEEKGQKGHCAQATKDRCRANTTVRPQRHDDGDHKGDDAHRKEQPIHAHGNPIGTHKAIESPLEEQLVVLEAMDNVITPCLIQLGINLGQRLAGHG